MFKYIEENKVSNKDQKASSKLCNESVDDVARKEQIKSSDAKVFSGSTVSATSIRVKKAGESGTGNCSLLMAPKPRNAADKER